MLRYLIEHPDKPVSAVARNLKVPRPVASQYLRALNARGLLRARREGRWVYYRASPDESVGEAKPLLHALERTFAQKSDSVSAIFRLVTAFTHPRRQEIFLALPSRGIAFDELISKTGISPDALRRHLKKLVDRGFVAAEDDVYRRTVVEGDLARTLARLACSSRK